MQKIRDNCAKFLPEPSPDDVEVNVSNVLSPIF